MSVCVCLCVQAADVDDSTLCKLQFVVSLVRCVLDLAESRRRVQSEFTMSTTLTANDNDVQSESAAADHADQSEPSVAFTVDHACFLSNSRCHLEQLVLYVRALQILSSAIQLARIEVKAGKLASSNAMKNSELLFACCLRLSPLHSRNKQILLYSEYCRDSF